ncbi:hypothetical protein [Mesorhizobium sp. B2-3-5]|uniref:hypothetical protein n=1 Tax=Mesorhizobium sp. B2-3-5 TaxID=2589958 RepID=UPI0015E3F80C|nr:hypothetical protein [Mesorhizobium sp. B2-3-5]
MAVEKTLAVPHDEPVASPAHDSALNLCYAPRLMSGTMDEIGRKPLISVQP